jgi:thiol-disulfide isomerase/thioredoxin
MAVKGLLRALILFCVLSAPVLLVLAYWQMNVEESEPATSDGGKDDTPRHATLGQFTPLNPPRPAPEASFTERDGTPRQLADFRGRFVLVNLWATWCAPCVREMPSLDRLQAKLGNRLSVLAVSEDRGGAHAVDPFLEKLDLKAIAIYLDPKSAVGEELEIGGLPTTFLIDGEGRVLGQLEGAAEWDSPKMVATIERYLTAPAAPDVVKTSVKP